MNIGNTIAKLRAKNGLSQAGLADLLFVSRDLVSKWETGARRPDYPTIEKLAAVFGVPPDDIADRNDVMFKELSECMPDGAAVSEEDLKAVTEGLFHSGTSSLRMASRAPRGPCNPPSRRV